MTTRSAMILLTSILLTACGGSGGSESGGVTVVAGPTPTPAPAPAPSPTPTPTPPATSYDPVTGVPLRTGYGTACNGYANGQNAFAVSAGIKLDRVFREPLTPGLFHYASTDISVDNYSAGLSFTFDAKTRLAQTISMGAPQPVYTFGGSDMVEQTSGRIAYAQGTKTLVLTCSKANFVSFQDYAVDLENPAVDVATTRYAAQMTGAATVSQQVIASASYSSVMSVHAFRTDVRVAEKRTEAFTSIEPANLVYDSVTKRLTGTIRVGGTEPTVLTIDMIGSNSSRFAGTVTSSDGAKGEIIGGFYGPNAEEIGFVTAFEKFGIHYVGSGSGTR